MTAPSDKARSQARAIAKHVQREGPITLPALARTFQDRGYTLSQFVGGMAAAFETGLLDPTPDPTWTVRAPR